jgi:hypothetical protein
MKKILLTICLLFSLSSVSAQEAPLYAQITDNVPQIGVKNEVYLGDRMLIQRTGEYRECLVPKANYEQTMAGGWAFNVKANAPICKKNADSKYYKPNYVAHISGSGVPMDGEIVFKKNRKGKMDLCWTINGWKQKCTKNLEEDAIENKVVFIYQPNTFQQSIEYAGRNDDNLKFTYSEFSGGFARQAFTRDFQIDYSKGDVTAYKGAIIKIHEATNMNIIYEVIRNFQQ